MDASFFTQSMAQPAQVLFTPTSGQTVVVPDGNSDVLVWLTPAGLLATCTVQLPSDASTRIGQVVQIGSAQAITIFAVTGATNIYNALAVLGVGGLFTMEKVAANTWSRLQ